MTVPGSSTVPRSCSPGGAASSRTSSPSWLSTSENESRCATAVGAFIPEPERKPNDTSPREPPIRAALDRGGLIRIANAGGGEYMELDREGDREISNRIIDAARKRAGSRGLEVATEELYWRFLLAAAAFITVGLVFLHEKTELWLQAAGAAVALTLVWTLTR